MKSLRTKILSLVVGSVFVTSFFVSLAGVLTAERVIKEDSVHILRLTGENKAQEINAQLRAIEQSVENIHLYAESQFTSDDSLWQNDEYMDQYTEKVSEILETTAKSTDCSVAVYARFNPELGTSEKGVFLARSHESGKFERQELTDLTVSSPSDRDSLCWYYVPIEKRKPTWLGPYYNKSIDVEMISYVIPVFREDMLIGVIGMDIDIHLLRRLVDEVSLYDTGYAFLLNATGDIVYHKEYPNGISKDEIRKELPELNKLIDYEQKKGRVFSYKWHGKTKKMVFQHLVNGMELVATAPEDEIETAKNSYILQCIVIFIIVIFIVGFIAVRLGGKIINPLQELTAIAMRVTNGERNIEIQCNSDDEVGVLAGTLQNMIREMNRYIDYIHSRANTDVLTGVRNKQAYNDTTINLNKQISKQNAKFCLMLIDINNLKYINDTYGRGAGDGYVIAAAAMMKKVFGENKIYRICDDGFAVIFSDANISQVEDFRKEFEEEVQNYNKIRTACPEELSLVIGVAAYKPKTDKQFSEVYIRADRRMYHEREILNSMLGMREDAIKMLHMVFHKIQKVNLTQDTYYEIKTYEEEHDAEKGYGTKFTEWTTRFVEAGQVHTDDKEDYKVFTNIDLLKERLKKGETYLTLRYRRKVQGKFRWVQMEIVPSIEYSDEEQIIMLYIRDVHDSFTSELEHRKELERLTNRDTLTGLYNRHYMTQYCIDYVTHKHKKIGVVFCDLNGLKYINDHYGHAAGDDRIIQFTKLLKDSFPHNMCCRMSGDEFVVCVLNKSEEEFQNMVEVFRANNRRDKFPFAAIGAYWNQAAESIGEMITEAENAMYEDKKHFYEDFPIYRR